MSLIKLLTSRSYTACSAVSCHAWDETHSPFHFCGPCWQHFHIDTMFLANMIDILKYITSKHIKTIHEIQYSYFFISILVPFNSVIISVFRADIRISDFKLNDQCWTILLTVVGWREAAGCLLHLPRDVRQVLLYTAAAQWSGSLLHGSEQMGGGWGGTSGGTRQGEVAL